MMNAERDWVGSRQMLRHLRDVMAGGGTPVERLDRITGLIAHGMVAEVCSLYVLRGADTLVLYGTEGLRKDAIFRTRLAVGEGLIGTIAERARSLALAEAQDHPKFAFRPETGEEIFHSLLGVPVLRNGRVQGVLAIQTQLAREFTDEEVETLETVAMVLAEMISAGDLPEPEGVSDGDDSTAALANPPELLGGSRLNGGIAAGHAVLHGRGAAITQTVSEDVALEERRLQDAVSVMQGALDTMIEDTRQRYGAGEHLEVLDAYRMIADDRGWVRRIREAVRGGLTAEAAVAKVQNESRARMVSASNPYLRERLMDLDDLAYRLLQHLTGETQSADSIPEDAILVARSIGPAELLDYDQSQLRGLIVDEGSATSHAAIVARALDIPMIGNVRGAISRIESNDRILLDGDAGQVHVRPGDDVWRSFSDAVEGRAQRRAAHAASRDLAAVTKDGVTIALHINAGLLMELGSLEEAGADGVGLCRTEIPFMVSPRFPRMEAQTRMYREYLDAAAGKPLVFRTLDIGGDKLLPYFRPSDDVNPAMGWRALRMALDRPALLRLQLRAMIRAAAGRELRVMFPMVSEVSEFDRARALLDQEIDRATRRGELLPALLQVGCMLEIPALAFQLPQLLAKVDFLSVGSNDLAQFLFASDRNNPRVADRYDVLLPAMLGFLRAVLSAANEADVPVSLCGEMAGAPVEAMALIGLGFRCLSMPPGSIGAVRLMLRALDQGALAVEIENNLHSSEHSLRNQLVEFAESHKIPI